MKRLRHWVWWDPPWKLYQWPPAWPFYFGGDEYGRRTAVLHLPLLGRLVVAVTKHGHFPLEEGQPEWEEKNG